MMTTEDGDVLRNRPCMHDTPALRVVGASLSPMLTDGHPQAILCVRLDLCYPGPMAMSIVWITGRDLYGGKSKVTDMIKEDWNPARGCCKTNCGER